MAELHRMLLVIFLIIQIMPERLCQAPQIVEEILPEVKRKGHSGYLNCTVARKGENKVYWMHENHHISSDERIIAYNQIINGRYKYEVVRSYRGNDKTVYMLAVHRLSEEDDGRYTCKIYLAGIAMEYWPIKHTSLTVQVPPTILTSSTSNTVERFQGTNATLRCNATGAPTPNITWIRADGKPLPDGRLTHRGYELNLVNIQKDSRGAYRCVADNTVAPPAEHDATLVVFFSPESAAVQDTVGQAQNRRFSATLECIIAGMPEPNLRWYRQTPAGEVLVANDEKYQISQLLNHGSSIHSGEIWFALKILNVQANDYTNYYCQGTNSMGTAKATIRLYETNECQGPGCSFGSTSSAEEKKIPSTMVFLVTTLFILIVLV